MSMSSQQFLIIFDMLSPQIPNLTNPSDDASSSLSNLFYSLICNRFSGRPKSPSLSFLWVLAIQRPRYISSCRKNCSIDTKCHQLEYSRGPPNKLRGGLKKSFSTFPQKCPLGYRTNSKHSFSAACASSFSAQMKTLMRYSGTLLTKSHQ